MIPTISNSIQTGSILSSGSASFFVVVKRHDKTVVLHPMTTVIKGDDRFAQSGVVEPGIPNSEFTFTRRVLSSARGEYIQTSRGVTVTPWDGAAVRFWPD